MYKYEMDPVSIVGDTERKRFRPQTDGQTDRVKPAYPPFNFVEAGVWLDITASGNGLRSDNNN